MDWDRDDGWNSTVTGPTLVAVQGKAIRRAYRCLLSWDDCIVDLNKVN